MVVLYTQNHEREQMNPNTQTQTRACNTDVSGTGTLKCISKRNRMIFFLHHTFLGREIFGDCYLLTGAEVKRFSANKVDNYNKWNMLQHGLKFYVNLITRKCLKFLLNIANFVVIFDDSAAGQSMQLTQIHVDGRRLPRSIVKSTGVDYRN